MYVEEKSQTKPQEGYNVLEQHNTPVILMVALSSHVTFALMSRHNATQFCTGREYFDNEKQCHTVDWLIQTIDCVQTLFCSKT